jgi:DNA-damage-inducible protein J
MSNGRSLSGTSLAAETSARLFFCCQRLGPRFLESTADTYVRARIDSATKERAADALAAMGLSISDAIRLLMLRIVDERRLPFEVKALDPPSKPIFTIIVSPFSSRTCAICGGRR